MLGVAEPGEEIEALSEPIETAIFSAPTEQGTMTPAQLQDRISSGLSPEETRQMLDILLEHADCFASPGGLLGTCNSAQHSIDKGKSAPLRHVPFARAGRERELIQKQVYNMIGAGVVEPSTSPWASPVVLVKKKDGELRFCVDYRSRNAAMIKDVYPLPRIEETLSRLERASYFSTLDLLSGYLQVSIREENKPKTALITADGLFQFRVIPFGLCSAPATFQRMIDYVLSGLKWTSCLVYLDDFIVYSKTFAG